MTKMLCHKRFRGGDDFSITFSNLSCYIPTHVLLKTLLRKDDKLIFNREHYRPVSWLVSWALVDVARLCYYRHWQTVERLVFQERFMSIPRKDESFVLPLSHKQKPCRAICFSQTIILSCYANPNHLSLDESSITKIK